MISYHVGILCRLDRPAESNPLRTLRESKILVGWMPMPHEALRDYQRGMEEHTRSTREDIDKVEEDSLGVLDVNARVNCEAVAHSTASGRRWQIGVNTTTEASLTRQLIATRGTCTK